MQVASKVGEKERSILQSSRYWWAFLDKNKNFQLQKRAFFIFK
jgi:hypothetical protein